jgi:outer membrane protein
MTQAPLPAALAQPALVVALLAALASPLGAQDEPQTTSAQDQPETPDALATVGEIQLSLEEAVRAALDNDLVLRITEIETEIAQYEALGSWGAFDPILTATAGFSDGEIAQFNEDPDIGEFEADQQGWFGAAGLLVPMTTGGSFNLTFDHSFTDTTIPGAPAFELTRDALGVEYRQPLLRGFGRDVSTSDQRLAELAYLRQIEVQRQDRQRLIADVVTAYWDLVAAVAQYEVALTTLELGLEQLEQNQRRLDAGVGTQVDVLQAEANVAQNEDALLLRETEVLRAADELKGLLYPGVEPATWNARLVPTTPLPEAPANLESEVPPWSSALLVAQDSRAELRQQRLQIRSAEVELTRADSFRRPQLDLVLASRSETFDADAGESLEEALGWEFPQHSAALDFRLPIGNRDALYNQRRARARLRAARLSYDQVQNLIVGEVRAALRQVIYSARAVASTEKSAQLAQSQLEAEQARYREGLSTNFQVLEFQRQLAEARSTHTAARTVLAKALMELQRSQGVLGELDP